MFLAEKCVKKFMRKEYSFIILSLPVFNILLIIEVNKALEISQY